MNRQLFSSESVCEGHPDKVCDAIADAVLDAHLEQDPRSRVACEALAKGSNVVLAGEIRSQAHVDLDAVVRGTIRELGYVDPEDPFSADAVRIHSLLGVQSEAIGHAVDGVGELGAGDQGIMFGYASDETPELMPLPILLAHRLSAGLDGARHAGVIPWARPDGKTQVTVRYRGAIPDRVETIVVSIHHAPGTPRGLMEEFVREALLPEHLGDWHHDASRLQVNPAGPFVLGGPTADCGVTGRKIIADTYGGMARHGGGGFSGKDPTKVDRSAAYFARYAARQVVRAGLAKRVEIQVAYAIGMAAPVSLAVDTFGSGDAVAALECVQALDFRPAAIIRKLRLERPIYRQTTNQGHFGRPGFSWEED